MRGHATDTPGRGRLEGDDVGRFRGAATAATDGEISADGVDNDEVIAVVLGTQTTLTCGESEGSDREDSSGAVVYGREEGAPVNEGGGIEGVQNELHGTNGRRDEQQRLGDDVSC
jgi:hypothetical protein